MVVIIDCRDTYSRRDTVECLCRQSDPNVRLVRDVCGDNDVEEHQVLCEFKKLVINADLVLLHCGSDQQYAAEALAHDCVGDKPCVAYYGGANPDAEVRQYFDGRPSEIHALIPEAVPLELQAESAAGRKLARCIRLIRIDGLGPEAAVGHVYGDPELDEILDTLYQRLVPGVDCGALTKDRNTALDALYQKRRGW